MEHFPIEDSKGNFVLEFVGYTLDSPKYLAEECIERGVYLFRTSKGKVEAAS